VLDSEAVKHNTYYYFKRVLGNRKIYYHFKNRNFPWILYYIYFHAFINIAYIIEITIHLIFKENSLGNIKNELRLIRYAIQLYESTIPLPWTTPNNSTMKTIISPP